MGITEVHVEKCTGNISSDRGWGLKDSGTIKWCIVCSGELIWDLTYLLIDTVIEKSIAPDRVDSPVCRKEVMNVGVVCSGGPHSMRLGPDMFAIPSGTRSLWLGGNFFVGVDQFTIGST